MSLLNEEGVAKAKPSDVRIRANSPVTQSNMRKFIDTQHAMVYVGDRNVIHASGSSVGIKKNSVDGYISKNNGFFVRPADLIAADKASICS